MNDKKLFNQNKETLEKVEFDFRKWFHQFNFSQEAMDLYNSALEIFRWYHSTGNYVNNGFQRSSGQDFNDGFKDITNGVMRYDYNNNSGIGRHTNNLSFLTRTSKGTTGFGRNTIKKQLEKIGHSEFLQIFIDFFDKRDILARKINKQLVESGLLLWERENIY